ncbi:MAG TPA: TonB-dependent receptor [Acidobacteriaceae bacterium]|nr:TonB-dependent receptor [Acidobacteriaceae bacterium]
MFTLRSLRPLAAAACGLIFVLAAGLARAQSNSGSLSGTVADSTGAVIPGATVTIANTLSGFNRTATTDSSGHFQFVNLPFNPYQISVRMAGFQSFTKRVDINSVVPQALPVALSIATSNTTVNVEATVDLTEQDPNAHTDIDRSTISALPVESASSQLSSIVTQTSPGVAADSDGQIHGLGDHSEVSFSIDGQPITDQQSKVFSNQVPASAVQSMEVIEGAPPAEYGDKTSLVIVATTRSGQGVTKPTGDVTFSYGSFGTANLSADLAYGGAKWGNFISVSGLQAGRFLDAPEFAVYHDKGNEENLFDRVDFQLSDSSSLHTNLQYTRSWFQTPNSYDTQFGFVQNGLTSGPTDQRSQIKTIDVAPTYTLTIGNTSVLNIAPYLRRDEYNYYPSNNPLNDLGPLQQESVAQYRTLTNAGVHADVSYVAGRNNLKAGGMYQQTFLRENDTLGIVDPALNAPGSAKYNPALTPYDLTRGGSQYTWHGHTDVKQLALFVEDQITAGHWLINAGVRGDLYNGLATQRQVEPRLGLAYTVPKAGTVLRASYARTQETPFNENLVLSSQGCNDPVLNGILSTLGPCTAAPFNPGSRNEFHAGVQQSIGHHFMLDGEYIWKYTHNGFDFSVLGATPITFPIEWHNSKIPGWTLSGTLTPVSGLSARVTLASVAARFFNPQIGGVGATIGAPGGYPFRIDHDEKFDSSAHFQYKMPFRKSLYYSFSWRFDSGMVAGSVPCYGTTDPNSRCLGYSFNANGNPLTIGGKPAIDLSSLTPDQEFEAGLSCDGVRATQTSGFSLCDAAGLKSDLVSIPAPGTENDDRNPQRIQPRSLFDMEMGDDNIAHFGTNERFKIGAKLTAVNLTNKYSLYNFLSTFSGTHYVTPRSVTAEVNFHF